MHAGNNLAGAAGLVALDAGWRAAVADQPGRPAGLPAGYGTQLHWAHTPPLPHQEVSPCLAFDWLLKAIDCLRDGLEGQRVHRCMARLDCTDTRWLIHLGSTLLGCLLAMGRSYTATTAPRGERAALGLSELLEALGVLHLGVLAQKSWRSSGCFAAWQGLVPHCTGGTTPCTPAAFAGGSRPVGAAAAAAAAAVGAAAAAAADHRQEVRQLQTSLLPAACESLADSLTCWLVTAGNVRWRPWTR